MSKLFDSYTLGSLQLRNRIVMAPMTRSRALSEVPDELTAKYYRQRASAGLLITEGAPVSREGRGYLFTPGLHNAQQIAGWRKVTRSVHDAGGKIFVQLWHVGRISHTSLQPDGGSPVSSSNKTAENSNAFGYDEDGNPSPLQASQPRTLKLEEIKHIQQDFALAAHAAMDAGFDGVEIHGANGYLFEQFINPTVNDRTDIYGGGIENRLRMLIETVDIVTATVGAHRVGVRISPFGRLYNMGKYDDEAETWLAVADALNKRNLAYVHLSDQLSDNAEHMPPTFPEAFRNAYRGSLIAAGGFNKASAVAAVESGTLDLIAFGRPFISNPDLVARMANDWPIEVADYSAYYQFDGEKGYTDYPNYKG